MAKRQIRDYVFTPGVAGSGTIKVLDKLQLNQILLITNTTDNIVLYNFSDPENKLSVSFVETTDGSDADFPYANTNSNGVSTITLLFDTSTQSSTDSIQIFVEEEEVRFRPYNFGTDAIERMRVATPQSMLDADFEYGLQPTKWQTIDTLRGYPSLYEIPGSDLVVIALTTDASSTTNGIGDSIITVTTGENHGFSTGSAIRIIGTLDTVSRSSRAEGSFVVHDIISTTSFRYYAKGKVGTTNNESLYSINLQLRKAGFYTGASIGTPTFSISSQGSVGIFTSNLLTPSNSNKISFTGIGTMVVGSFLSVDETIWILGQVSNSDYTFTGPGFNAATDPAITVNRGQTYKFTNTMNAHPFRIQSTVNGAVGTAYNTGVTNNDVSNGTLTWVVPLDAPNTLYYQCTAHNSMGGVINVIGNGVGIITGSQITGIVTTSFSKTLAANVVAPTNTIILNDSTDVLVGSALSNGSGSATFVSNIVGNTLTLSDPILVNYNGSNDQIGIFTGTKLFGNGIGALFDVDRIDGKYITSISRIEKASITGVAASTHVILPDVTNIKFGHNVIGSGIGVGATVVQFIGISTVQLSVVNSGTVSGIATFTNPGIGYTVNDRIIVNGNVLGGQSLENNLIVKVVATTPSGGITSISSSKSISLNGTPKISTAQAQFGGSSMLLNPTDGTTDYISIGSTSEFQFGTGNFTVDFWIYRNRTGTTEFLYDMRTAATQIAPTIYINSSDYIAYYVNGADRIVGVTTATVSTWHHVAVSRSATTTRLFVNGILDGTYTDSNNYPEKPVAVGARGYDGTFGFYGYIDELRVSKELARFTSAFNPISAITYTNDAYNSLYLHFRGLNNSTTFSDDSKGTAILSSQSYINVQGVTGGGGTGASFDILRVGGASPSYSVTLNLAGSGYAVSDTIVIDGSSLGGQSSTNDLTITIASVSSGAVVTFTITGTASNGNLSLKALGDVGLNATNSGGGATFNISKNGSSYLASVQDQGSGYYPEYQV